MQAHVNPCMAVSKHFLLAKAPTNHRRHCKTKNYLFVSTDPFLTTAFNSDLAHALLCERHFVTVTSSLGILARGPGWQLGRRDSYLSNGRSGLKEYATATYPNALSCHLLYPAVNFRDGAGYDQPPKKSTTIRLHL